MAKKSPVSAVLKIGLIALVAYAVYHWFKSAQTVQAASGSGGGVAGTSIHGTPAQPIPRQRGPVQKGGAGFPGIGGIPGAIAQAIGLGSGSKQTIGNALYSIGTPGGITDGNLAGVLAGIFNQQAGYDYYGNTPNSSQTFGLSSIAPDIGSVQLPTDPNAGGLTLDLTNWGTPVSYTYGSSSSTDPNANSAYTDPSLYSSYSDPAAGYSYADPGSLLGSGSYGSSSSDTTTVDPLSGGGGWSDGQNSYGKLDSTAIFNDPNYFG